jgi:hypothetical protein
VRVLQRAAAVEIMRRRLARVGFPRLQVLLFVGVAGAAAFAVSAVTLRIGLDHMGLRYGLASVGGYLAFLVMIRLWIAWQRGRWEPDVLDVVDTSDLIDAAASSVSDSLVGRAAPAVLRGGRSGGGGASAVFDSPASAATPARAVSAPAKSGAWSLNLDADEAWPVVLAIGCAALGLVAIFYTIWLAPVLLAEVAVDAAIVTALYRKLRREDAGTWIGATLRRTWVPALAVVILMMAAGTALQYAVPEARSIGGVVRTLASGSDASGVAGSQR